MISFMRHALSAIALFACVAAAPGTSDAANGDCGQPLSNGDIPTASDALNTLQTAVQIADCNNFDECVCDVDGNGSVTATDALTLLQIATQIQSVDALNCDCGSPVERAQCSSGQLVTLPGSDIDAGWNGLGHNQGLIDGAGITAAVVKRCALDNDIVCKTSADCPGGTCDLTCLCDSDSPSEQLCEVTGPTGPGRCLRDLSLCEVDADCASPQTCESFFGPPLPLSSSGTPACITTYFAEPIVGTADSGTGEGSVRAFLRSRVHLGVGAATPCPTCGAANQSPQVGDTFSCGNGSPNTGATCTVDAVSPLFGGVSFDCPPDSASNVSGQGLAIIFTQATTGIVERQAVLPCAGNLAFLHPSSGAAFCMDNPTESCSTNSDCTRCTDDLTPCASDAECNPGASCAESPDQPISCGIYCHCGFCGGGTDVDQPCFSDADCDEGDTCAQGGQTGGPIGQASPNGCANFICGQEATEECSPNSTPPTAPAGSCSLAPFRPCQSDSECSITGSGVCEFENLPCFENRIIRQGVPSTLDDVCDSDFTTQCIDDADCPGGSRCVSAAEPATASLYCIPPSASDAINAAAGVPGPGAIQFVGRLIAARCGNGVVEADEECDDGNLVNGDGCNEDCRID